MSRAWNYRLVRIKADGEADYLEVRSIYYEDGEPISMSDGVHINGPTPKDVLKTMELVRRGVESLPVFDPPESWKP